MRKMLVRQRIIFEHDRTVTDPSKHKVVCLEEFIEKKN